MVPSREEAHAEARRAGTGADFADLPGRTTRPGQEPQPGRGPWGAIGGARRGRRGHHGRRAPPAGPQRAPDLPAFYSRRLREGGDPALGGRGGVGGVGQLQHAHGLGGAHRRGAPPDPRTKSTATWNIHSELP